MSEEIRKPDADQTGGDANAQNASSGEVQLRPAEADAQNPAGEADMGAAAAAGAEEPEGEAGAAGGAADVPAGDPGNETGAGAAEAAAEDGESTEADAEPRVRNAEERAAAATARLADTMVRAALQRVGVPEGRAEIAAKLMDTADVDPMAEDAAQRYAEAAQRLVAAVPEFVPAGGTGSSGEHPRRAANPNDDTTSAFRRGMGR